MIQMMRQISFNLLAGQIMNQNGFTLIELLVVISIIGLLSSVALASVNGARIKARDTERKAEIEQIKKAMEMYYNDNGQFPVSGGGTSPSPGGGWSNSNHANWATLQTALSPYLSALPVDPKNSPTGWAGTSGTYTYTYFSSGYGCDRQWYMIVYRLESGETTSTPVRTCNGTNFNYGGTMTVGDCKGC